MRSNRMTDMHPAVQTISARTSELQVYVVVMPRGAASLKADVRVGETEAFHEVWFEKQAVGARIVASQRTAWRIRSGSSARSRQSGWSQSRSHRGSGDGPGNRSAHPRRRK